MDKATLKAFATKARGQLLERVALQARKVGITEDKIKQATVESSDAIFIDGRQLSHLEKKQRNKLLNRIAEVGYERVIEETAYTWFNRFIALRFMEVNDFLPTRVRVFSSENKASKRPDMLEEALSLQLDIDKQYVYELKIANKTDELFKYLIKQHCNDLNRYMPFMFATIEDYMLILFPDGLLGQDSFLTEMVNTTVIAEEAWENVEIIGWLYQYYIAEENERVISAKKRYKSTEIPYATQLFTPEWIVRYMVQNSLGRYWIESNPQHRDLIANWEYFIENDNAGDDEEKLTKFINKHLNVEQIKCFDPAMGSGHVLIYMFDCLYDIYRKCGYIERDIPRLIIENNLYGLDIDDRAYQLASFAIIMKALQYNRRFLRSIERDGLTLNLTSIQETNLLSDRDIAYLAGEKSGEQFTKMKSFIEQFHHAKSIGSLLHITSFDEQYLNERLVQLEQQVDDLFEIERREQLLPLLKQLLTQAKIMNKKYDIFVTNPPYAGRRYLTKEITSYLDKQYPQVKFDLFSAFMQYSFKVTKESGQIGFMTPYVWMFIATYEKLRAEIINNRTISSLIQLEYSGFEGATVPICTFTLRNYHSNTAGQYIRLADFRGAANQPIKTLAAIQDETVPYRYKFYQNNFNEIPGKPIAYWASENFINSFKVNNIGDSYEVKSGIMTGNDALHLRLWHEVANDKINFTCEDSVEMGNYTWFPINKGGEYKKYFGNNDYVINLKNDGQNIREKSTNYRLRDKKYYFKKGITWSRISSSTIAFRLNNAGTLFGDAGPVIFVENEEERLYLLAFLISKVTNELLKFINPTLNYQIRDIETLPLIFDENKKSEVLPLIKENVSRAVADWNRFETSAQFDKHPLLAFPAETIEQSFNKWEQFAENEFTKQKGTETELNRIFINIYNLQKDLSPEVSDNVITIRKANKERDIKSFISYAIGCIFGRYSLDEAGLVFAGGKFDKSRYETITVAEDNILPILPGTYFEADLVARFVQFVKTVYSEEKLAQNLSFIAEAIGQRKNETAQETLRRYFIRDFYKDHGQTYKKRPIYWQFTSGPERAFNCFIYVHRYDEMTLSRIRTDYLHPAQTRYEVERVDLLTIINGESTAKEIRDAKRSLATVERKIAELKQYDEKLHHLADTQLEINLDDGVKVNYEKFGKLLAVL